MAKDKYVFNISVPVYSLRFLFSYNMSIFFKNGLFDRLHKYEIIIDINKQTFYFFILKYILRIK